MINYQEKMEARKLRRNTDPESSKIAALRVLPNLSERREQVWACVESSPGLTASELGRKMHERYPKLPMIVAATSPQKRLVELERLGLVQRQRNLRKCTDTGYFCHTWELCPDQKELF